MSSLSPKLQLRVAQKQILTPGLVQMVTVLQLNRMELKDLITAEIAQNPVLEETGEAGDELTPEEVQAILEVERERDPADQSIIEASRVETEPAEFEAAEPEFIGQAVDRQAGPRVQVDVVALDDLGFPRLDFFKLDIEGMELEALQGAERTVGACRPIMLVEHVKAPPGSLQPWLEARGYRCFKTPMNILAVHQDDPCLASISDEGRPAL